MSQVATSQVDMQFATCRCGKSVIREPSDEKFFCPRCSQPRLSDCWKSTEGAFPHPETGKVTTGAELSLMSGRFVPAPVHVWNVRQGDKEFVVFWHHTFKEPVFSEWRSI